MTPTPASTAGAGRRWTPEAVIEAIREWVRLYGEPPRAADLNPSAARWSDQTYRIERYHKGHPETGEPWPALNSVKKSFGGSLSAAIEAAGFEPNKPGPPARRKLAAPDVEREDMTPKVRARIRDLESDVRELAEKVEVRERMLERERQLTTAAREDREVARRQRDLARAAGRPKPVPKPKTKVETKVVREVVERKVAGPKVVERVVEVREDITVTNRLRGRITRLEARLADRESVLRGEKDQVKATATDLRKREREVEKLAAQLEEARTDVREGDDIIAGLRDRVVALERRPPERVEVEVVSANDEAVAVARQEAHEAEVRTARAERKMRELACVVTGEDRLLTPAEVAELRKGGASGPGVLTKAIKEVALAKSNKVALRAALTKVAGAAIRWRESLT